MARGFVLPGIDGSPSNAAPPLGKPTLLHDVARGHNKSLWHVQPALNTLCDFPLTERCFGQTREARRCDEWIPKTCEQTIPRVRLMAPSATPAMRRTDTAARPERFHSGQRRKSGTEHRCFPERRRPAAGQWIANGCWSRQKAESSVARCGGPDRCAAGGQSLMLSSLRGRIVVLVFMLTTCDHCQRRIPVLNDVQNQFGQDVQVVGSALSDTPIEDYAIQTFIRGALFRDNRRE